MSLMDVDDDEDDWANNCFKMAARPVPLPPPGPPPPPPPPLAPPPLPLPPLQQQPPQQRRQPQTGGLLDRLAKFSACQP